jgi:glucosamine--fructose-6-phosphate aminotransferase (isomerizing)
MCGIVGYSGDKQAVDLLMDGLKRLEYRGYDSAGLAILTSSGVDMFKTAGRVEDLSSEIGEKNIKGGIGIAHTRWATHGVPTKENAHPHCDCGEDIFLVHNGIIENFQVLKDQLKKEGHRFDSDTDTEVVVHLIEKFYKDDLLDALQRSLALIEGAFSLLLFSKKEPDRLLAAKKGSPLVLGVDDDGLLIASDTTAIIRYTRDVIYMEDGEIADIKNGDFVIVDFANKEKEKRIQQVEWDIEELEKKGYEHFMLKEIYEQPDSIRDSLRGRTIQEEGKVKLGGLDNAISGLTNARDLVSVACGTAYYAALIGEYMMEEYAEVPTKTMIASEFKYKKQLMSKDQVVLALSQSGETADTLSAIQEANERNIMTLGIVNVVGSTIARETRAGVYNHIGPEIAVASTKAFTSQLTIFALLSVFWGRMRNMSLSMGQRITKELEDLPEKAKKVLETDTRIQEVARKYHKVSSFAFLGRKYNYPLALEGALKLKEISYIHAEGFPAGEIKHGPLALVDKDLPSFFITPRDSVYEKNLSSMQEIKARGGSIITLATEGDEEISKIADEVIYIPKTLEMLTPVLAAIPLQLFAYHMAVMNGRDVDKPRNLAKSVTVE